MAAVAAALPQEAVRQDAAFQEGVELGQQYGASFGNLSTCHRPGAVAHSLRLRGELKIIAAILCKETLLLAHSRFFAHRKPI